MDSVKPRVYITNYSGHGYESAEKYGEFVLMTRGYVSFGSLDRIKLLLADAIEDSTPEDFLVLSGNNIICSFAAVLWYEKHKKIKLLCWDKPKPSKDLPGRYRVVEFNPRNIERMRLRSAKHNSQEP